MYKSSGHLTLQISQNVDSAAVLLLFRRFLGGAVTRGADATGSTKAVLKWQVCGSHTRHAAATLSSVPSMKQAQLQIAANGPIAHPDRGEVERQLQLLKQPQHMPSKQVRHSWAYFAGFFDAEGCVSVERLSISLGLEVTQLNPYILAHFMRLLHQNGLDAWKLYSGSQLSRLVCSSFQVCKQTLYQLLGNGLMVKREQACLALMLTKKNHLQTREGISSLNGRQGRSQRLDEDGILRAKGIKRLQDKINSKSGTSILFLQHELDERQANHTVQNLISRCRLLRKDMRRALSQGGQVTALTGSLHREQVCDVIAEGAGSICGDSCVG